jgi:alanine dehydrogenase
MRIGCPKEIKAQEGRVALTPAGADAFVRAGHTVYMQKGAGLGSGFADEEYTAVGAQLLETPREVYDIADMIIKVKEPLAPEYELLREGQILFTYLHLAPDPEQTQALLRRKVIGIAYETVQPADGSLPLLAPMSEVAGRMAVQVGATMLEANCGGRGILLGGVTGVERGNVVVLGGGNVGTNAAKMAVGLGANVTVLDVSIKRLAYLEDIFGGRVQTLLSNPYNIARAVKEADLVIGCVLIPGARRPSWSPRKWYRPCAPAPPSWMSPSTRAAPSRPSTVSPPTRIPASSSTASCIIRLPICPAAFPAPPRWP